VDLHLKGRFFLVTGASSGLGKAITGQLVQEGAEVLAIARNQDKLDELVAEYGSYVQTMAADVTDRKFLSLLGLKLDARIPDGVLVNAGGPPAGGFFDTDLNLWDEAYQNVLLWKVSLLKYLIPLFKSRGSGRVVMIESISVKQPVQDLILSNAFRPAVVGMAKTLASEVAKDGITINILAPGYHDTSAMQRLYQKKSLKTGHSVEHVKKLFIQETETGHLGVAADFAQMAAWLLSPASAFVTGQVISVAGNQIKGLWG